MQTLGQIVTTNNDSGKFIVLCDYINKDQSAERVELD